MTAISDKKNTIKWLKLSLEKVSKIWATTNDQKLLTKAIKDEQEIKNCIKFIQKL